MSEYYDYEISICILTMNNLFHIKNLLKTLSITEFDKKIELVIVDNNSEDGTREFLNSWNFKYDYTIIFNSTNMGCTGGRNQAISISRGKYIVLLDSDVEIINRVWLKTLYDFYNSNSDIGVVGAKLLYKNNETIIQHAGVNIDKTGKVFYIGQGERDSEKFTTCYETFGCAAACWMVKKELFEKFGNFDNVYFPVNFEDLDFCCRIRGHGYKTYYNGNVVLLHDDHSTTSKMNYNRINLNNGKIFRNRWINYYI